MQLTYSSVWNNAVDYWTDSVVAVALGIFIKLIMNITKNKLFDFFGNHQELGVYDIISHTGSRYSQKSYTLYSEANMPCNAAIWFTNIQIALSAEGIETTLKRYEVFLDETHGLRFNATFSIGSKC